jgi:NitT/TauT family transport system substrate-binding protein
LWRGNARVPLALVQKIVNDPEIEFTISPQRSFVYASELNRLGVLKNKATSWKDYFFPEAYVLPGS